MRPTTSLVGAVLALAKLPATVAETVFNGDILSGIKVISHLDLSDVPSNAITRYYLCAGELNGGLALHIPVFVARGPPETLALGKKLSLSASIHGDELNPVRVVQRVMASLEDRVDTLNGTVIAIPTVNPVGIYLNQRNFFTASDTGFLTNVNRVFPGELPEIGGNGAEYLAYKIWNNIWGNTSHVDVAVDLHTPSSGDISSLWCYADVRAPYVARLAKLLQPDTLLINPGEPGSIETTFVENGVPAITVEIGQAKRWIPEYIDRVVSFVDRLLDDLLITPSEIGSSYEPDLSNTLIATTLQDFPSKYGGFAEALVGVDGAVAVNQTIAHIRNAFGDILESMAFDGTNSSGKIRIHQMAGDPSIEPGASAGQIIYNSTDPACADGCIL